VDERTRQLSELKPQVAEEDARVAVETVDSLMAKAADKALVYSSVGTEVRDPAETLRPSLDPATRVWGGVGF
jgi:hypothetical protein